MEMFLMTAFLNLSPVKVIMKVPLETAHLCSGGLVRTRTERRRSAHANLFLMESLVMNMMVMTRIAESSASEMRPPARAVVRISLLTRPRSPQEPSLTRIVIWSLSGDGSEEISVWASALKWTGKTLEPSLEGPL